MMVMMVRMVMMVMMVKMPLLCVPSWLLCVRASERARGEGSCSWARGWGERALALGRGLGPRRDLSFQLLHPRSQLRQLLHSPLKLRGAARVAARTVTVRTVAAHTAAAHMLRDLASGLRTRR